MIGGKARIKNENAKCIKNAADACPQKCIIIEGKEAAKKELAKAGVTPEAGQGRGFGASKGRGLGIGPRNGRGGGRGGGGRRI